MYTFIQFLAVQKDKFARENNEALRLVAVEMPVSSVQELGKLARI